MSVELNIRCDGKPGGEASRAQCETRGYSPFPWYKTATKIRRCLRICGWHRLRDGRDICPKCWEEGCHKPGVGPAPSWCVECECRRPCLCDGEQDCMPLPGEEDGDFGLDEDGVPNA